jgi:sulfite reductase (NADPH) flavoprotein alpha-component
MDMADYEAGVDFNQEQVVLVVCSTQGDGVPPNTAREFCDWLQRDAVPITSPVSFSVLALGDKSYTHYCRCGKRIDEKLHELGAKRFVARADVDKENWKVIDAWIADVTAALPSLSLTGTQGQAVSSDNKATKAFGKNKPFYSALKRSMPLCVIESKDDKETIHYEFDLLGSGLTYQPGDALGIYPLNSTKLVDSLLAVARLDANVQVEVCSHLTRSSSH